MTLFKLILPIILVTLLASIPVMSSNYVHNHFFPEPIETTTPIKKPIKKIQVDGYILCKEIYRGYFKNLTFTGQKKYEISFLSPNVDSDAYEKQLILSDNCSIKTFEPYKLADRDDIIDSFHQCGLCQSEFILKAQHDD